MNAQRTVVNGLAQVTRLVNGGTLKLVQMGLLQMAAAN